MGNLTAKESGEMVNIISPNVNNITSFKVHFNPKQEGTGDPSPENVREIVSWNGVEGYKCGKNLFDYAHANILDRHIKNDNGVSVSDGGNSYCQIYIPVMPNTTYTLSGLSNEKAFAKRIYYYDKDKQWISRTNGSTKTSFTITTPSNCRYIQIQSERQEYQDWSTVQVELGNTATKFEPYKYGTVLMDWTDTIGNIYGGYVDLVTGELVATQKLLTITGNEDVTYRVFQDSIYTGSTLFLSDSEEISSPSMSIKGVCSFASTNDGIVNRDYLRKAYSDRGLQFYKVSEYWGLSEVTSEALVNKLQTWNSLGTPLQICYSLANPITVATLSPIQLSTLKGQNNFWSNADYVEIEYELTETFDIQKVKRKIILNQPHVESTSGTIAKPETDMIGKIKECKIHFMPVQQGDSDPTPDNIVPVTGWTGIDVYQAFVEYPITPIVKTTDSYNVKFKVDNDGLVTAFGVPSSYSGATIGEIDIKGDETLYGKIEGNLNNITFNKPTLINSNNKNISYTAGDGILQTGLDLSLYNDVKKVRINLKRASNNVSMSGSCNIVVWKNKTPEVSITNIDWTNEVGTIYGGYVDLISGKLVQNYYCYQMTGTESFTNSGSDWVVSFIPTAGMQANPSMKGFCSHYPYAPYTKDKIGVMYNEQTITFDQRIGDATYWKNFCTEQYNNGTPVTLAYELNTSITYQLTSQQLTTLRGINNIWSSANGEVEIKYWKH